MASSVTHILILFIYFFGLITTETSRMFSAWNRSNYSCLYFVGDFGCWLEVAMPCLELKLRTDFSLSKVTKAITSVIQSFHTPCACNHSRVGLFTILCPSWLNLHVWHDLILLAALWSRLCYSCCQMRKPKFRRINELINPMSPHDNSDIEANSTCFFPPVFLQNDGNSGSYKFHYSVKPKRNIKKYIVLTQ